MQATEKKTNNKVWLSILSVGVVIAIILGVIGIVNHNDTKENAIPTINQQVDNINNTLPQLEKVSTELKGYIDTLETTVEKLQTELSTTNTAIDTLETEVYGKVDAEKTATLNQLKADKAELESKIAAANKAIEDAKAANTAGETAISEQIAALEAELEKADADNKKALEDSIAALEAALTTADADNKQALEDSIAALKTQVESNDASLTTAIQTLNTNLSALIEDNADNIADLQIAASDLQEQVDAINSNISSLKTELEGKITESEQKVLGELNTLRNTLESKIATINTDIVALQSQDARFENQLTDLRAYVDAQDSADRVWADATFATLEQYSAVQTAISGIRESIDAINADITTVKHNLEGQVEVINGSISRLETELATKVTEITTSYTNAIATAKTEITSAYTTAIETAIESSETSMKSWVTETLTGGYYTIADVDAALTALETKLDDANKALAVRLLEQETALETAKTELTTAYKAAIETAINDFDGKITAKIANDITDAKIYLENKIEVINNEIADIKTRLNALETDVAALLAQIQSVNYIPMYDDGKVKVAADASGNKYAFFDFMVSPKSILADIDEATLKQYLSMQAIYTHRAETRGDAQNAVSFVDMEIMDVSYNADTGVLTIKASGSNLSTDFYDGSVYASAFLTITAGKTEIISDYIPMVAYSNVWVNIVTVEDWINVTLNGGEAEEI